MRRLENLEEARGRIIKKSSLVSCDERLIIEFNDSTFIAFGVEHYGDSFEISVVHSLDNWELNQAGIISDSELAIINAKEEEEANKRTEKRERGILKELKEKYEN